MEYINQIKTEFNYQILNIDLNEITNITKILEKATNIHFTGVGKSGTMAEHCCNLLKSIGLNSYYLNTLNATHGDIGSIKENDVILFFSKSGNTEELMDVINILKSKNIITIGVCCDKNSKFKERCHKTIELPFNGEISGEISNIPTNSCMSQLLFSNLLVSILKEKMTLTNYKLNHPSGNIGEKLKRIKDVLITFDFPKIIIEDAVDVKEILLEMCKYKYGCCIFVDKNNVMKGILTDGDIRRLMVRNYGIDKVELSDINENYYYETDVNKHIFEIEQKYRYIPILSGNTFLGIIVL